MLKLIVLAAFIAFGGAAVTKLGEKRCTWGPSFWCDKYSNAIKCNAVEHCKTNVWKTGLKGSQCNTCKEVLQYMHTILANNLTQGLIIDGLEEVCNILPGSYKAECTSLITTYGTEIIQVIAAYTTNPDELCSLMGLCASSIPLVKTNEALNIPMITLGPFFGPGPVVISKPKVSGSAECILCEYAMTEVEKVITSKSTLAEIENVVDNLCKVLPSTIENECLAFVNTYSAEIIKLLTQEVSPKEICTLIGVCTSSVKAEKVTPVKAGEFCQICQLAMNFFKTELSSNATESEIIAAVEAVCNYVPASFKQECDSLVEEYGEKIIKLLLQEFNPDTLCKDLGLCTSSGVKTIQEVMKSHAKHVDSTVTCELCEYAMGYLDKMIEGNATEQQVVAALESLCNYLPSSYKGECDALVEQYGGMIVKLIVEELASPAVVCKELGLCTATSHKMSQKVMKSHAKSIESTVTCELCEYAMGYLDKMIEGNATEQEVVAALESLCNYLPSSFKSECDALVEQYGGMIVKLIVEELASPATICKELGLCSAANVKKIKAVSKKTEVKAGEFCEVCEVAMGYLKTQLSSKATKDEIVAALETVCNYVSSAFKEECDSLIKGYGGQIIDLLIKEFNPDTICKELGLCTSIRAKVNQEVLKKKEVNAGEFCQICELAMGYLKSQLSSNATETEIIDALESVCNYLPASYKSECDSLIEQYGREILGLLLAELTPDLVCKELGLCTASRRMLVKLSAVPAEVKSNVDGGAYCEVCELAMGYVKKTLSSNSTEEEIITAVKSICHYLPSAFATECNALLSEYGEDIIKTLLTEFNPELICQQLGLCTSKTSRLYSKLAKPILKRAKSVLNGATCEICTLAMSYLKSALSSKTTEEEIVKAVESLCVYVPSSVQSECDGLIEQYGKMIVDLIVSEVTPDQVCKSLGLCSSAKVELH